jgi:hypothetical protein
MKLRMVTAGVVASFVLGICAGSASAGTYIAYSCKLPNGTPIGNEGWVAEEIGLFVRAYGCSTGALGAALEKAANHEPYARAIWRFDAPPGTTILAIAGNRRKVSGPFNAEGGVPSALLRSSTGETDHCQRPAPDPCFSETADVNIQLGGVSFVQLEAACYGGQVCPKTDPQEKAIYEWRSVAVTLEDTNAATGTMTGGTLLDSDPEHGVGSAAFSAQDLGGGVAQAVLKVDRIFRSRLALGGAKCQEPYRSKVPCPTSASGTVELDTAQISDGDHEVSLELVDAAGNVTAVFGPVTRTFDNRPPVITGTPQVEGSGKVGEPLTCADPAVSAQRPSVAYRWYRFRADGGGAEAGSDAMQVEAWFAGVRRPTTLAGWGLATVVEGRVRDGRGRGIGGVPVTLTTRGAPGMADRQLAAAQTEADGGFRARFLTRLPSTSVVVRAQRGADLAAADLSLKVQAGIALSVPRQVRPKGLIRFRGRLLGGPFPAKGKLIELRARSRGAKRWIPFRTIRAKRDGTFRTDYRLRRGFRNITYEFQALAREEAAYPYAAGTSATKAVRVR